MFYVKGDDMEDMFKKAADEYELNENLAADWNAVQSALEQDKPSIVEEPQEKKRKRYLWFWLFLLIPASLFTTYEAGVFRGTTAHHNIVSIEKNKQTNPSIITNPSVENKSLSNKSDSLFNDGNKVKSLKDDITKTGEANKNVAQSSTTKKNQQFNSNKLESNNNSLNKDPVQQQNLDNQNDIVLNKEEKNNAANDEVKTQVSSNPTQKNNNLINNVLNHNNKQDAQALITSNKSDSINKNVIAANAKVDSSKNIASSTKKQKSNSKNNARKSFVYAGLSGLADLSFVRNQKTSNIGFGGGLLAGYHFKNGLSIESGVLLDKKNYYTAGKYFNKDKLNNFLQNSTIIYADGDCNMWEVPLNMKYDFNSKKKYNWFVTTGISSYFMKKEYYDMQFEKDGTVYQKGYDYYHSANNIFSVLNLGAGVNIQAGKKYFIQAQPYYKIPLSGIGTGKLSLSSGGVSVSVMRRF